MNNEKTNATEPGKESENAPTSPNLASDWKPVPNSPDGIEAKKPENGESPTSDNLAFDQIDAFYDSDSGLFYRRNDRGDYQKAPIGSISRFLRSTGFSSKTPEGASMSPKDSAIEFIETHKKVDFAGPLAGYPVGVREIHGVTVLVTEAAKLIQPKRGEWPTLQCVFEGLLGEEQCQWFYCWLKVGAGALRANRQRPGQALVIAGPPRCGKSLCQAIITELLGGREAKPFSAMTGKTDFNSELFGAEHLTIEDEAASADPRIRKTFGSEIKKITVNRKHRCHKKNREAITLYPLWRLSITLNDDVSSLQVLPQLEDGIRDKLMLLKAKDFTLPVDTSEPAGEEILWNKIESEFPAFLHYLLNDFSIPSAWKESRCGVRYYHNPELLELIDATSDEYKLLELIDDAGLWDLSTGGAWNGKASELEDKLRTTHGVMAARIFSYSSACGQLLAQLKNKTDRVKSRKRDGYTIWTINPPIRNDRADD